MGIFFKELNKNSISYCHWKSNEHLADGLRGKTDLDILVDKNQAEECESILKKLAFRQVFSPSLVCHPYVEDWIGFNNENGSLLHIHLHFKLLAGKKLIKEQYLPFEKIVLDNRVFDEKFGIFVAEPSLEFIILTLRIGVKTRFAQFLNLFSANILPENINREIQYLRPRLDQKKIREFCKEMFGKKDGERFKSLAVKLLKSPNSLTIFKIKIFALIKLYRYRRYGFFKTNIIYFFNAFRIRLLKFLNKLGGNFQTKKTIKPKGLIVALIGADGSGKSTIVKELHRWFLWKFDVYKLYLGQNKNIFMRFLRVISVDLRSAFYARFKYKKILKAYKLRKRGSIVLTDRYPQKQFFGINDGPLIRKETANSWLHRKLYQYENKIYEVISDKYPPDIVIKLHISPQAALARKNNINPDYINKKADIIKNLSFQNSLVLNIDASQDLEEVLLEIKQKLWENLRKKKNYL